MDKEDLKKKLSEEEYYVTQEKGTERPFHNIYWDNKDEGLYMCKVCGAPLFDANRKYDSGTGWPSFDDAIHGSVKYHEDTDHGMSRVEVICSNCGAHLGHVFDDGPAGTTGKRFCTNSASLSFRKRE
ncbi:MAG: peptide-methionine (R)-S-oxide reductase MsrB [Candidatus Pacebacteria bacterium]|nr:peptide-methionine (R)-S-oxide reductase MsrB [Candidatus Paceibacterota bacterium]MBP9851921.1 peptide-methionine (R)-S-oxide reductase MsrB [Candidatus Paceibacterota bacterium]